MTFKQLATGTTLLGLVFAVIAAIYTQPTVTLAEIPTLITLLTLYAFTEFFPLKRGQFSVSLSLSVDLLIFIKFGLVPLMLISQIIFFFARWRRERKLDLWKTLGNGGMFLVTQSLSALVFTLTGGHQDGALWSNLLPLFCYIVTHLIVNHILLFFLIHALNGIELRNYLPSIKFDAFSTLFAASLGYVVILLYQINGQFGLLAFGFPMILCVYVFKLFNDVSRSSALFRNLANLTGDFSGELEVETMSRRVVEELPKWFDNAACAIFVEQGGAYQTLSVTKSCSADTVNALRAYLTRRRDERAAHLNMKAQTQHLKDAPEFAMTGFRLLLTAPFHAESGANGFLCLLSHKPGEFDNTTTDAVSILANQFAVSYRNALRYENVEKQSLYDELTNLPNHRFCERRLSEEILRFEGQAPLSLLLIDLDHFKSINDQYGHQAGNVVLQKVARTFESCLRKSDFVARYGGEEFLVVLPGASSELASQIGEKIRNSVANQTIEVPTMDGDTVTVALTVSIGIATCPDDADDAQQLVRYADRAMYHGAKRAGRNRVAVYQSESKHS